MTSGISKIGGSGGMMTPPPDIQAQLDKYGLQPLGSSEADKAQIAAARTQKQAEMKAQQGNKAGKPGKPRKPMGPPPDILAQLMQFGLQPQGSLQADQAAIDSAKAQSQAQNGLGTKLNVIA